MIPEKEFLKLHESNIENGLLEEKELRMLLYLSRDIFESYAEMKLRRDIDFNEITCYHCLFIDILSENYSYKDRCIGENEFFNSKRK